MPEPLEAVECCIASNVTVLVEITSLLVLIWIWHWLPAFCESVLYYFCAYAHCTHVPSMGPRPLSSSASWLRDNHMFSVTRWSGRVDDSLDKVWRSYHLDPFHRTHSRHHPPPDLNAAISLHKGSNITYGPPKLPNIMKNRFGSKKYAFHHASTTDLKLFLGWHLRSRNAKCHTLLSQLGTIDPSARPVRFIRHSP